MVSMTNSPHKHMLGGDEAEGWSGVETPWPGSEILAEGRIQHYLLADSPQRAVNQKR